MRETGVESSDVEKIKKFAEKHWPVALAIAGAAGAVGAAIWFTARYLREKKIRDKHQNDQLVIVEKEVEDSHDPTTALLVTGTYLGDVSGEVGKRALTELVQNMDDEQAKEALEVLREVITIEKRK